MGEGGYAGDPPSDYFLVGGTSERSRAGEVNETFLYVIDAFDFRKYPTTVVPKVNAWKYD